MLILETLVKMTEKRGLNVLPHQALMQGDELNHIKINFMIPDIQDKSQLVVREQIEVNTFTSTTVWEFIVQVA